MTTIAVRVRGLDEFYSSIDPAPMEARALDDAVASHITERLRALPSLEGARIEIHMPAESAIEAPRIQAAVRAHFARVADAHRVEARRLRLHGWKALGLGLLFVAILFALAEVLGRFESLRLATVAAESLVILAWVVLWRPMDMLLFDRWILRADARRAAAFAALPVEIRAADSGPALV